MLYDLVKDLRHKEWLSLQHTDIWQGLFGQFDTLDSHSDTSYHIRVWKREILVQAQGYGISQLLV